EERPDDHREEYREPDADPELALQVAPIRRQRQDEREQRCRQPAGPEAVHDHPRAVVSAEIGGQRRRQISGPDRGDEEILGELSPKHGGGGQTRQPQKAFADPARIPAHVSCPGSSPWRYYMDIMTESDAQSTAEAPLKGVARISAYLKTLPDAPGVYRMLDA